LIKISPHTTLHESEIKFSFIRSPGPGGQNVNKVATGVLLRFNLIRAVSLPCDLRIRLQHHLANRITTQGDILIKATRYRTQERNKQDALDRLQLLLTHAALPPKKRHHTKPTKASIERRLTAKKQQAKNKTQRRQARYVEPD